MLRFILWLDWQMQLRAPIVFFLILWANESAQAGDVGFLEKKTCVFFEESAFDNWRAVAASQRDEIDLEPSAYERHSFLSVDAREIRGIRLIPQAHDGLLGPVLILLGTSMEVSTVIESLTYFSEAGHDVYVFDYRGYGASQDGKPLIKPLISDAGTAIDYVYTLHNEPLDIYAISFGGLLYLWNSSSYKSQVNRVVLDAVPSTLPAIGICPAGLDPIDHVPKGAGNILLLHSQTDRVVASSWSEALRNEISRNGGKTCSTDFDHPYIEDQENDLRFGMAVDFFNSLNGFKCP